MPVDKRHSLNTILLSEQNTLGYKFESNLNTVKECSIATINNEKIISSKLSPYSVNIDFIINNNFNQSNCDRAIKKQLNQMFRLFYQSLMQDQIKIYQENLNLIENSEDTRSKVVENILNELRKENKKNININLLQSNLIDSKNLINQKNAIDRMQNILKVKDPFAIYGEKISFEKTYPAYIFIFSFMFIFVILNYSLFHKSIKKFIK